MNVHIKIINSSLDTNLEIFIIIQFFFAQIKLKILYHITAYIKCILKAYFVFMLVL